MRPHRHPPTAFCVRILRALRFLVLLIVGALAGIGILAIMGAPR